MKFRISRQIQFLLWVHLTALLFLSFFRFILLYTEWHQTIALPTRYILIGKALFMGLRFDNVIACYIALLPLLVFSVTSIINNHNRIINKVILIYFYVMYSLTFFIVVADIPYFNQFFRRLDTSVFNWTNETGFVTKMIVEDKRYLAFLIFFIVTSILFIYIIRKLGKKILFNTEPPKSRSEYKSTRIFNSTIAVLLILACMLGIRGRISRKSPIRVGTAYFSNYAFPNMLGLNPAYTLLRSYFDSRKQQNKQLNLMDSKKAISNVREYLHIKNTAGLKSPLARYVETQGSGLKANVVVVLMEGLSANYLKCNGNPDKLTVFLDSLATQSYYFNNIYSSGIHTMNGIYAVLFSFPSLLKQHPLKQVVIPPYTGFANILADKGYQSIYFSTHDDQFDNIGGFLTANGYQQIIAQKDYPASKVKSTLGVPDDYMFDFSMPYLNSLAANKKPFLAVYLTASNHGPVMVPEYYKSNFQDIYKQIIEYSDWSLKKFFTTCKKQSWFENTIFVFVADHGGGPITSPYDAPLSFFHVPLIINSAKYIKPSVFEQLGGQMDIFPTVMGILNESYVNNTMGIDLLKEERPFIYFSADDKIGCINHEYYLINRTNGKPTLYKYRNNDIKNYLDSAKALSREMENYTYSMLQTTQWLIYNKLTGK